MADDEKIGLTELMLEVKINVLKEVLADGDYKMGSTGVLAGAHWNAIKRKLNNLESELFEHQLKPIVKLIEMCDKKEDEP